MDTVTSTYGALASLLTYPGSDYQRRIERCRALLDELDPEAGELIGRFEQATKELSPTQFEELFTHTFDLNPICSLEVGWHLYGENYSRGEFLVSMRQQLREHALPESTELPDHLTHVLTVLCRLEPAEADRFTMKYVLPALEKMLGGIGGKDCPYEHVLEAIRCLLLSPYGAVVAGECDG